MSVTASHVVIGVTAVLSRFQNMNTPLIFSRLEPRCEISGVKILPSTLEGAVYFCSRVVVPNFHSSRGEMLFNNSRYLAPPVYSMGHEHKYTVNVDSKSTSPTQIQM